MHDVAALRAAHATSVAADEVWRWFDSQGIQYGPSFRALAPDLELSADGASLFADLRLPTSFRTSARGYTVHPVLLDACFQTVGAFARVVSETNGRLLLPLSVRSLRLHRTDADAAHCLTRLVAVDALHVEVDIDLLDASGRVLLSVEGLAMGSGAAEQHADAVACNSRLLDITWQSWDIPRATVRPEDGAWLLLEADAAGHRLMSDLDGNLRERGFKSRILSGAAAGKGAHGAGRSKMLCISIAPELWWWSCHAAMSRRVPTYPGRT
ncbi:polyketide synthase dehydratase domain-containing protein [Bradyrhizobium sp. RDT46]|uniref:polyketide synthase dehydratase domain-containing protein n=1 Tax=Bradyrhizobium sp. RDT46 TaxID=3341829 RepID=UPI0035C7212E